METGGSGDGKPGPPNPLFGMSDCWPLLPVGGSRMADYSRFPAALAFGAVLSMAATPVAATEISAAGRSPTATIAHPVFDADAARADNYRHYRYRHHRNHISTGDVLAGVLIIGGTAAIANT